MNFFKIFRECPEEEIREMFDDQTELIYKNNMNMFMKKLVTRNYQIVPRKRRIHFYWLLMLRMHIQVQWMIVNQFILKVKVGFTNIENMNDNSFDYFKNRCSVKSSAVLIKQPQKPEFISPLHVPNFRESFLKSKIFGSKTFLNITTNRVDFQEIVKIGGKVF